MPDRNYSKIALAAAGTLVVFGSSCVWFYVARAHADRSLNWPAVTAIASGNRQVENRKGQPPINSKVVYSYNGQTFETVLDIYQIGEIEVYVNPDDPSEVRVERGATLVDLAYPLVGLIGSILFAIFLGLLVFSPK